MSAISEGLMYYPSGFLGSDRVVFTKPLDPAIAQRTSRSINAIVEPNLMAANAGVQGLWDAVCSGEPHVNSFEFRELILRTAKNAFGTDTLYQWLVAQVASPTFTPYHADYLNETLEFALYGVRRRLSYNNWVVLLSPNHAMPPRDMPNTLRDWVGDQYQRGGMSINSFIASWVRQEDGIVDLLQHLFVLFGKR